jgi:hypothetical protein
VVDDLTGQIGLVYGPQSWQQRLICWVTNSPVYHCVIATSNDTCVGAEEPHPIERPISHFGNIVWSDFDLTDEQRRGIVQWVSEHMDATYNTTDDVAIGIERLMHEHTPKRILRRLSSSQHLQCAQLCDASYTYGAGIQVFRNHRYFGAVAPADFVPLLQDTGAWPDGLATTYRRHFRSHRATQTRT